MPGEKQIQFEPLIEEIVPPSTIRWRYTMRLTALDNR